MALGGRDTEIVIAALERKRISCAARLRGELT